MMEQTIHSSCASARARLLAHGLRAVAGHTSTTTTDADIKMPCTITTIHSPCARRDERQLLRVSEYRHVTRDMDADIGHAHSQ